MDIVKEIRIAADRKLVWKAWTESERITQWFAPEAHIQPEVGGAFELYFNPGNKDVMSTKGCKFIRLNAPETLAFEWKGPDPFAAVMNEAGNLTVVEVVLEKLDGGTAVRLRHSGWGDSADFEQARAWHVEAWEQMLGSLKSSMEAGEGILCCQ
ncbi:SRPBCC family protein [Paenibacillus sp. DMB20]|uniref:SRPBCC family protein n=1 Tax=Paenibacillus sp. DMB20 TaxID=1642570 RepID=UPI0006281CFB|nr:SRPBCC domain-containing protein [Paenibacillus sp. DMB20]KKO52970.1 ATPase [Paenibacillus sp. DMB20]KKO53545.1 ATPase [Paenibacillus sp. DMB20]